MIQRRLRKVAPAVYAVHELQGTVGVGLLAARLEPVHEPCRLFREADTQEAVEGEGGVPDPGVPVVPVALSADALGQTHGGGRHDGARRLVGEQLEGEGRATDHLPPAARVGALREPAPPVFDGSHEELFLFRLRETDPTVVSLLYLPQDEDRGLFLPKRELGESPIVLLLQGKKRRQAQAQVGGMERRPAGDDSGLVLPAGVIEGGGALHPEGHGAAHHLDAADDLVAALAGIRDAYRHVVRDLPDPIGCKEPRDEHVSVGPVELLARGPFRLGGDPEPSAPGIVEDGREDARGVMARQAQPVYGTVHPHQGRGVQIADDPVVLDGPVARRALFRNGPVGRRLVDLHLPASSSVTGLRGALSSPHYLSQRSSLSRRTFGPWECAKACPGELHAGDGGFRRARGIRISGG